MKLAIVHDYLTQRGGAERVVLSLSRAFPEAPVYTSLYDAEGTFPEFAKLDVRTLPINRVAPLRKNHRAALPLLAASFSRLRIEADVVVCSSSGWAHGAQVEGRKIVYCHTPARWLYQSDRYLRGRSRPLRATAALMQSRLERWDKQAAASADTYLANSTVVAERIKRVYRVDAEIVPPPPAITPDGPARPVPTIEPGYILCVSRLLPYKNIDAILDAFNELGNERLILVGDGPERQALRSRAGPSVTFLGTVEDVELRWLYANCRLLVAASHEDFGLTPLEAAGFGKPTVALRFGGYLDTVVDGETGNFFAAPTSEAIAVAVLAGMRKEWNARRIITFAHKFSESRFVDRIRHCVASQ